MVKCVIQVKVPSWIGPGECDYKTYNVVATYNPNTKELCYIHPVYDVEIVEKINKNIKVTCV